MCLPVQEGGGRGGEREESSGIGQPSRGALKDVKEGEWRRVRREERRGEVFMLENQGRARTQSPTNINYASESPTFGVIAEVNPPGVQWTGLALGEPP